MFPEVDRALQDGTRGLPWIFYNCCLGCRVYVCATRFLGCRFMIPFQTFQDEQNGAVYRVPVANMYKFNMQVRLPACDVVWCVATRCRSSLTKNATSGGARRWYVSHGRVDLSDDLWSGIAQPHARTASRRNISISRVTTPS